MPLTTHVRRVAEAASWDARPPERPLGGSRDASLLGGRGRILGGSRPNVLAPEKRVSQDTPRMRAMGVGEAFRILACHSLPALRRLSSLPGRPLGQSWPPERRPGLPGGASYLRMPPRGSDYNVRLFASVARSGDGYRYLRTTHQSTARRYSHRSFDPPLGEFKAFWGPRLFFISGFKRLHHV